VGVFGRVRCSHTVGVRGPMMDSDRGVGLQRDRLEQRWLPPPPETCGEVDARYLPRVQALCELAVIIRG